MSRLKNGDRNGDRNGRRRLSGQLNLWSLGLFVLIAFGAFYLSFDGLKTHAMKHGLGTHERQWIFPILLDAAIVACCLRMFDLALKKLPTWPPFIFISICTSLSVFFNCYSAPLPEGVDTIAELAVWDRVVNWTTHAIAPIVLFALTKMLLWQILKEIEQFEEDPAINAAIPMQERFPDHGRVTNRAKNGSDSETRMEIWGLGDDEDEDRFVDSGEPNERNKFRRLYPGALEEIQDLLANRPDIKAGEVRKIVLEKLGHDVPYSTMWGLLKRLGSDAVPDAVPLENS